MPARFDRRDFIKTTGLIGAGYFGSSAATSASARAAASPSQKLNIAVIGLGGQGSGNLKSAGNDNNIVALCDVDDVKAGKAYETYSGAKKYYDFRKMFDEMESKIDAVVISTPDHTHFHPAYSAISRGKHVYLEKPMAHSVWEVRKLTDLAREKKVATQLGVQRHTLKSIRRSVELIQCGAIGTVTEVHSWIGSSRGMPGKPDESQPVPSTLKWDLWVGPAPERPYSPDIAPYKWRFFWDYGTGEAGNWGCHILDIPFWALDLKYPTKVQVTGANPDPVFTPKSMSTQLDFPAGGKRGPVALHWYQGSPPILAERNLQADSKGMNNLFIGSEGMLLSGFNTYKLLPGEKAADFKEPDPFLYSTPGFHKEWLAACRGGTPASCNFDYSGPMSETVLLANVAYRAAEGFAWNADKLETTGSANAQKFIRSEFRKGWEI